MLQYVLSKARLLRVYNMLVVRTILYIHFHVGQIFLVLPLPGMWVGLNFLAP